MPESGEFESVAAAFVGHGFLTDRSIDFVDAVWLSAMSYPSHFLPVDVHLLQCGFASSHFFRLEIISE